MDQCIIDYYPYILGFGVTFGMSIITNIVIICFSDNSYGKLDDSTINYDNKDIDIVVDDENVITSNNQMEEKGKYVDNGKIELTVTEYDVPDTKGNLFQRQSPNNKEFYDIKKLSNKNVKINIECVKSDIPEWALKEYMGERK